MKKINRVYFAYEPSIIFQRSEQWLFGREPILRRMPNEDLISLIYSGGKHEPSPENLVLITRSTDDGLTWCEPEVLFKHDSRCCWGTEIFTEGPKVFVVFHTYDYAGFYSELRAFISYTNDSGKTWSEPATPPGTPANFCMRQGKVLSNGAWCFPVYWQEQTDTWNWNLCDGVAPHSRPGWSFRSGVARSFDQGKTYSLSGYLSNGEYLFWEPEITELTPGHLLMFLRSDGTGVLWQSDSFDYGATWTPARTTSIPNVGSKVSLFQIEDKIVLAHNPSREGRRFLELWVSSDGCKSWEHKLRLAEVRDDCATQVDPTMPWQANAEEPPPWICYPHGFVDAKKRLLYLACDSVDMHYLIKVPFSDILEGLETV